MKPYKTILLIITLILLISGCREKDDLTLPVKVFLEIGLSQDNSMIPDYLGFTEGSINIKNISFEGARESGGNVFFETDFRKNVGEVKFSQKPSLISAYDLPQGIYNFMKWSVTLYDGDDFDYTIEVPPGIVLSGYYRYLNGTEIPLTFFYEVVWEMMPGFSIYSKNPDGNSKIALSVDNTYMALVLFKPEAAFMEILRDSLEEAEVVGEGEHGKLIISSKHNKHLYELISYKIFQCARIVVK